MKLFSRDFPDMGRMPLDCTFGTFERYPNDGKDRLRVRENRNPSFRWTELPADARSLVIMCDDLDAADVDLEELASGRVAKDVATHAHCHWVLVDLPVEIPGIDKGEFSDGAYLGGKPGPATHYGARQGINAFTNYLAKIPMMQGDYFGYDGPSPPHGADPHRYRFTAYAMSVPALDGLSSRFTSADALAAMAGKMLDQASVTGMF